MVLSLKGDLDHYAKSLHLRHDSSNQFCDLCPAAYHSTIGLNPLNFGPTCTWQRLTYSSSEWFGLYQDTFLHWVFGLVGVSNHMIEPDELHVLYLGVSGWFLGSVLWVLVYDVMDKDASSNMDTLWEFTTTFYSEHSVANRFGNLNIKSFTDPQAPTKDFPKLKGKGAELKDFACVALAAWLHFNKSRSANASRILNALRLYSEAQDLIHEHKDDMFIPLDKVPAFQKCIGDFLLDYTALARAADRSKKLLWNTVPKLHWMYHFGVRAKFLCPRVGSTFLDEDFMGRLRTMTHASAFACESHRGTTKMVEPYVWVQHVLVQDACDEG